MYRRYVAAIVSCCAVIVAGCSDSQRAQSTPEPGSAQIAELPRALTDSERAVVNASNRFGLEVAARVTAADPRANVIISPLSASMALGMTLNGADGATFDAMRSSLGFDSLSQDQINGSYRDLIDLLTRLDPQVRFEIANAIWAKQGIPFHDTFFETVAKSFDARAETRDFGNPATLAAINAWVKQSTGGQIERVVDSLDPALVALLVNAIYFDGNWTTQFDVEKTRRAPFTREDGSIVNVDMMSIEKLEPRQAHGPTYAAVELPYGGEAFSMVIVLSNQGVSARDWLAQLDIDQWTALTNALGPGRLDLLSIPKLKLTYDAYLNDALQAMGMDPAFKPGADFTRMSPVGNQMCIDFVRQKTFVEVDERGTRAAAATAVGIGLVSFNGFVVDRPFVFVIRERLTGTILFVGLVGDPTAAESSAEQLVSDCTGAPLR
jgi:serine protease inhibitor